MIVSLASVAKSRVEISKSLVSGNDNTHIFVEMFGMSRSSGTRGS